MRYAIRWFKCKLKPPKKGGGGAVEGGGVQAGNEREGAAVQEVGASVRVSILTTAILSCLSQF